MTLPEFSQLSQERQFDLVNKTGTFLGTRWHSPAQIFLLYQCPGDFLVEVGYNPIDHLPLQVAAFAYSADRIDQYTAFVQLPDWLPKAE